jgi:hypothetical protein
MLDLGHHSLTCVPDSLGDLHALSDFVGAPEAAAVFEHRRESLETLPECVWNAEPG